ncbi:MAG TPA: IPT/TIG domain-containing protein [Candidatus Paceibacterota bacterium]|jgi:hypothetical protein|nr:IPT/TIG domain-containing protein [Candidatus Paceibacterota bacterium]
MSKSINKTKIKNSVVFSLFLIAILVFTGAAMPAKASAQSYDEGYDDGYDHFMYTSPNPIPILTSMSPKSANATDSITTITLTGHGFTSSSVARWNGVNKPTTFIDSDHLMMRISPSDMTSAAANFVNVYNPKRDAYSEALTFKISGFVASKGNTYNNTNSGTSNNSANGTYVRTENNGANREDDSASSLASNAIFGANSLVPTGLIQWVLFGIVILLIILVVRKFTGASDDYHNSPLKYS